MDVIYSCRGSNIIDSTKVSDNIWSNVLERIREKLPPVAYAIWFEDTRLVLINRSEAIVMVPSTIHKRHMKKYYGGMVDEYLSDEVNRRELEA